ncbi:MAG TPA: hypothetical protein VKT99_04600 [Xanthobacteraceae bacterium]|nr:hypothetical protein [Xanthobacteraceae bacterium]
MCRRTFLFLGVWILLVAVPIRCMAASETKEQRALFRRGAKLWPIYCARCHQAIPASAYSPAQWDTIMLHMRARASLTGEDASAIMKFLQAR